MAKSETLSKSFSLRPLSDRVVVKPADKEEKTISGIIIPDSAKEKPAKGTVISVGPGRYNDQGIRIPMDVKIGDQVYFKKPWDEPIKIDGVEYYVLSESDITLITK